MESTNTSAGTVLLSILGGAILGAGVALLYAPQSGRRTRRQLRQWGEDAGDCARDLLDKTGECFEDVRAAGEEWAHKGRGHGAEKRQTESPQTEGGRA